MSECVTTIKAVCDDWLSSKSKSDKTEAVFWSREPVGSSARIALGLQIIALTNATLWHSPPDSL